jgi:hypothetical protein
VNKWISVKDGLPGVGKDVLIFVNDRCAVGHIELYNEGTYEWWYDDGNHSCAVHSDLVTHWMLLPEPPESEGESGY